LHENYRVHVAAHDVSTRYAAHQFASSALLVVAHDDNEVVGSSTGERGVALAINAHISFDVMIGLTRPLRLCTFLASSLE
jgi:hypothetical protein